MNIYMTVLYLLLGIVVALLQRFLLKKIKINKQFSAARKNIGISDRIIRFILATGLIIYGIWSPSNFAIAAAGYVYYEAFAKWCGLYALFGKDTCPLN